MVCFHIVYLILAVACCLPLASLDVKAWWRNTGNSYLSYVSGHAFYRPELNPQTVYCISCVMVCKIGSTNWNAKVALFHVLMIVTYYIKLFRMGANGHNSILISLLLLVAETISILKTPCVPVLRQNRQLWLFWPKFAQNFF